MDFEQIKRHPSFPFRNFATDDLSFLMLELYWLTLFKQILSAEGKGASDWEAAQPADREEANPILSMINRTLAPARAIRIIQRYNTEGLAELNLDRPTPIHFKGDAYVAFVPDLTGEAVDYDGSTPIEELLISSDITPACERMNTVLIQKWCVDRIPEQEMRELLDSYWQRVRANLIEIT